MKLNVKFENCYGIRKLENTFDFDSSKIQLIYASNGTMKSSFAKTFSDISLGRDTSDRVFPSRVTVRKITDDAGKEIPVDSIFVIEPFNAAYKTEKLHLLLANADLQARYREEYEKIDKAKNVLLKKIGTLSGTKKNAEKRILESFGSNDFLGLLVSLKDKISEQACDFSHIEFEELFNEKAYAFLTNDEFKNDLAEYVSKYNSLLNQSKYLRPNFNHQNALNVKDNLAKNGFFSAHHSVNFYNGASDQKISSDSAIAALVEEEKKSILDNPDLTTTWNNIDKKLNANETLRDLRKYLSDNKDILNEIVNLNGFGKKMWISYLADQLVLYNALLEAYREGKEEISKITLEARKHITEWKKIISTFNSRFYVPFEVAVNNQEDVILKQEKPIFEFRFKSDTESQLIEENRIREILSTGEQKALYILNLLYEINARVQAQQDTLLIVDDIADSFDYRNKYAIIQYLSDISVEFNFKQIILTHNFDFFRTLNSRVVNSRNNCYFALKDDIGVKLCVADSVNNPFTRIFLPKLHETKYVVASIPFLRNIVEYTRGTAEQDFLKLTSLLHTKSDTNTITIQDVKDLLSKYFPNYSGHINRITDCASTVISLIYSHADQYSREEGMNLANKIVLSIAARLKAEEYMLSKIQNASHISSNQTSELLSRYKNEFPNEQEKIRLLEDVLLMTSENIHVNSFMFEPIIDISDDHLQDLYSKIKGLFITQQTSVIIT